MVGAREGVYVEEHEIYIPSVAFPLWKIRIRERCGIEVDDDLLHILRRARYARTTWKIKRTERRVFEYLLSRGFADATAARLARVLVAAVVKPV